MVYVFSIFDRFINEGCMFFSLIICGFVYRFYFFIFINFFLLVSGIFYSVLFSH